jgi:hypothetical protein
MAHPGLGWPTTPARSKDGQCGPSSPSAVPAGVAGPAAELMPDAVGGLVWWRTISLIPASSVTCIPFCRSLYGVTGTSP